MIATRWPPQHRRRPPGSTLPTRSAPRIGRHLVAHRAWMNRRHDSQQNHRGTRSQRSLARQPESSTAHSNQPADRERAATPDGGDHAGRRPRTGSAIAAISMTTRIFAFGSSFTTPVTIRVERLERDAAAGYAGSGSEAVGVSSHTSHGSLLPGRHGKRTSQESRMHAGERQPITFVTRKCVRAVTSPKYSRRQPVFHVGPAVKRRSHPARREIDRVHLQRSRAERRRVDVVARRHDDGRQPPNPGRIVPLVESSELVGTHDQKQLPLATRKLRRVSTAYGESAGVQAPVPPRPGAQRMPPRPVGRVRRPTAREAARCGGSASTTTTRRSSPSCVDRRRGDRDVPVVGRIELPAEHPDPGHRGRRG